MRTHRKSRETARAVSSLATIESFYSCLFTRKVVETDINARSHRDRVLSDQRKIATVSKLCPPTKKWKVASNRMVETVSED